MNTIIFDNAMDKEDISLHMTFSLSYFNNIPVITYLIIQQKYNNLDDFRLE